MVPRVKPGDDKREYMLKTPIPSIDLRGKTPIDLLRAYPDKAQALIRAARRTFGVFSQAASAIALPLADRRSHAWLKRSCNPYLYEIESFAEILGVPGIFTLNVCYEWGCTSGAYHTDTGVSLLRVLDWPFPALGQQAMVVRQQGRAGDYYNVTWPGVSGVLTAMAPGRFSAALNQAPMRRHKMGICRGLAEKPRIWSIRKTACRPRICCARYSSRRLIMKRPAKCSVETPLAMPAIFILAGVREAGARAASSSGWKMLPKYASWARQQRHGQQPFRQPVFPVLGDGWRPRGLDSAGRYRQSCGIHGHELEQTNFDWLRGPIINSLTRLAFLCRCRDRQADGAGYEGMAACHRIIQPTGGVL